MRYKFSISDHLISLLQKKHRFQPGDNEEVEIRGVSVHAATLIANELRDKFVLIAKIINYYDFKSPRILENNGRGC